MAGPAEVATALCLTVCWSCLYKVRVSFPQFCYCFPKVCMSLVAWTSVCYSQGTADDSEQLFPGSTLSVNQALAILFSWFGAFPGISKEVLGQLLYLLHNYLLPVGNKMPASYPAASSATKSMITPIQDYHCCINDCVLFRNSSSQTLAGVETCPTCGEARYEHGTRVPRKRFHYLPLAPRLHRLFGNSHSSELLQLHAVTLETRSADTIVDIHQSQLWKELYSEQGLYRGDSRGISLGLCADGLNPFSKEGATYSMWPVVLTILNFPRHIRYLPGSLLLMGIIPGKSEPKTTDPYLELLVEEIMEINGTRSWDSFRNEDFNMQVSVQLHVLDYPGQNKLFHCQGTCVCLCVYVCVCVFVYVCVCLCTCVCVHIPYSLDQTPRLLFISARNFVRLLFESGGY